MENKSNQSEIIKSVQVGGIDKHGYKVLNILATSNEYVIYEVDIPEFENRLKVLVDGLNDNREEVLISRYQSIEYSYLTAKSLLYRTNNYNLMRNRIADALAAALDGNVENPQQLFDTLIKDVSNEYNEIIQRKLAYLLSGLSFFILFLSASILCQIFPKLFFATKFSNIIYISLCACIGGVMSMIISAKKYRFDEWPNLKYYILLGFERISLSILSGAILFVGIKSDLIFGTLITQNNNAVYILGVLAGFSENFIPTLLSQTQSRMTKEDDKI